MAYIKPMGAPDPPHLFDKPTPPSTDEITDAAATELRKEGLPVPERKPKPKP